MDIREINRRTIEQFRAGAEIEGMQRDRLVLLTTTGRRSGDAHTCPMMFHDDERGTRVVIASNVGAERHPEWYLNLVAHPGVTVEAAEETYAAEATTLQGAERARVWAELTAAYPFFLDHQQRAGGREIPLVALTRSP